jgi:hypothetical protein
MRHCRSKAVDYTILNWTLGVTGVENLCDLFPIAEVKKGAAF